MFLNYVIDNLPLVAMVNHTAIHNDIEVFDDECPDTDYGNHTEHQQDGEFEWSTTKQGWILSSFFYGYVMTQVIRKVETVFEHISGDEVLNNFQCQQRLIGI